MEKSISEFVASRNVAIIGVSLNRTRFGNAVYRTLKERGYRVYPVHPEMKLFDGEPCFANIRQLPSEVDAAVIAVAPNKAEEIIRSGLGNHIKRLWFQQGADFSRAAAMASETGIHSVTGKCLLLYVPPVTGLHAVHRFFARLFGTL